ncbi:MAG: phosphoribosylanthranilate isomerase [Zhongshania sp.]|uniref:phosphoribosylanthranilate isomerase n=1 Tax=Zhongshania sp. TaxID=1971902 RepID=UPI0026226510|nr:phosphoribosylanthranilate isomerase [Zhongshania sp.]MDF1693376.1 phosphoribosylanthranilate isomerase [Zhongshania sp.]
MSRTRVKICGITRAEDAEAAISAGADALGFVFYAKSPRALTAAQAALIIARLPPFVSKVGLFVNANADDVREVLATCSLDLLQFHGDETAGYCESFAKPYMKALRMRDDIDLTAQLAAYSSAAAILLDSYKAGVPGGTGEVFNWERIPSELSLPLVLAGGLRPNNAGAAILACRPYALDVSGGVESAPGIKCADAMTRFIDAVSAADRRED